MRYGGFWQRWSATCIDAIVLSPLSAGSYFALSLRAEIALPLLAFCGALSLAYEVVPTALFGRTLGKMVVRLCVVGREGEAISWGRALLRSAPRMGLAALQLALLSAALLENHPAAPGLSLYLRLVGGRSSALEYSYLASWLWSFADATVLLLSGRRRAFHDFLAGTVVIQGTSAPSPVDASDTLERRFDSPPLEPPTWGEDANEPVIGPGQPFPCPACDSLVNFGASECRECGESFRYIDGMLSRAEE